FFERNVATLATWRHQCLINAVVDRLHHEPAATIGKAHIDAAVVCRGGACKIRSIRVVHLSGVQILSTQRSIDFVHGTRGLGGPSSVVVSVMPNKTLRKPTWLDQVTRGT